MRIPAYEPYRYATNKKTLAVVRKRHSIIFCKERLFSTNEKNCRLQGNGVENTARFKVFEIQRAVLVNEIGMRGFVER